MKKSLHYFYPLAAANLLLIFVMVLLGAYVKNSGSSLACPDWPLCFGQVFPEMSGGVAIEHSHRLLGSVIGLLTLALLFIAFRARKDYPRVWRCSLSAFFLVCLQGILGGVTVLKQISPLVSATHWMISQIYLANVLWLVLLSRNSEKGVVHFKSVPAKVNLYLNIALVFLLIQFLLGALTRHLGAAMACGVGWENSFLCLDEQSGTGVLWPSALAAKLHMKHRLWGILTFAMIIAATIPFLKWAKKNNVRSIRLGVVITHIAVTFQVLLGMKVVGSHLANYSVLLHVLFAMILWSSLLVLKFKATEMKERPL
jgi:heme A synthase